MPATLNFFDTYMLMACYEEVVPQQTFFKDRYFPTGDGDIFATDKVLTEYKKGDKRMAAFVSARAGDIPVDRQGYAIHEYEPAYIAPSRLLSMDDLRKRGFGEAIYSTSTAAERADRLTRNDLPALSRYIERREEWMCAQTIINNACTMQTYLDDKTQGETLYVQFYDAGHSTDHTYANANSYKWNSVNQKFIDDVKNMCRMLSRRGLPSADLLLGDQAADAVLGLQEVRELLDKNLAVNFGSIDQTLTAYDGVTVIGRLNFGGHWLNVICVDEEYVDEAGSTQKYFPATSAAVLAPGCGHLMYGAVTQIDYRSEDPATHAGDRIPKFTLDQDHDLRKLRLASRPLAAPVNYAPWVYAANVVS